MLETPAAIASSFPKAAASNVESYLKMLAKDKLNEWWKWWKKKRQRQGVRLTSVKYFDGSEASKTRQYSNNGEVCLFCFQ